MNCEKREVVTFWLEELGALLVCLRTFVRDATMMTC
jgi:hypothetical protein